MGSPLPPAARGWRATRLRTVRPALRGGVSQEAPSGADARLPALRGLAAVPPRAAPSGAWWSVRCVTAHAWMGLSLRLLPGLRPAPVCWRSSRAYRGFVFRKRLAVTPAQLVTAVFPRAFTVIGPNRR